MAIGRPDMKILVVDDFPTMRRIVKTLMRQNGYNNFVEAEDGVQGLKALESNPDVEFVVSDWNMPNMSGLEFLKAVRSDSRFSQLPFLMVTAESEKDHIIEAVRNGVSSYIVKPFTGAALQEKLTKIFSTRRAS
ncbi:MAG: response regulator [bacterium]|jgi:two-component system chemotaxis response regulator CheY